MKRPKRKRRQRRGGGGPARGAPATRGPDPPTQWSVGDRAGTVAPPASARPQDAASALRAHSPSQRERFLRRSIRHHLGPRHGPSCHRGLGCASPQRGSSAPAVPAARRVRCHWQHYSASAGRHGPPRVFPVALSALFHVGCAVGDVLPSRSVASWITPAIRAEPRPEARTAPTIAARPELPNAAREDFLYEFKGGSLRSPPAPAAGARFARVLAGANIPERTPGPTSSSAQAPEPALGSRHDASHAPGRGETPPTHDALLDDRAASAARRSHAAPAVPLQRLISLRGRDGLSTPTL
jgi:hypothetical protein